MGWMYEISREADMKSWDEGTGCTGGEAMRCDDAVPSRLETTEYRRSQHNPIPKVCLNLCTIRVYPRSA